MKTITLFVLIAALTGCSTLKSVYCSVMPSDTASCVSASAPAAQ